MAACPGDHAGTRRRSWHSSTTERYNGRYKVREPDTIDQMASTIKSMGCKQLIYTDLIKPMVFCQEHEDECGAV